MLTGVLNPRLGSGRQLSILKQSAELCSGPCQQSCSASAQYALRDFNQRLRQPFYDWATRRLFSGNALSKHSLSIRSVGLTGAKDSEIISSRYFSDITRNCGIVGSKIASSEGIRIISGRFFSDPTRDGGIARSEIARFEGRKIISSRVSSHPTRNCGIVKTTSSNSIPSEAIRKCRIVKSKIARSEASRISSSIFSSCIARNCRTVKFANSRGFSSDAARNCGIVKSISSRDFSSDASRNCGIEKSTRSNIFFSDTARKRGIVKSTTSNGASSLLSESADGARILPDRLTSSASAVYVHIPFCRRRCFYCDFTIVAVGERTEETKTHMDDTMGNYVELLCKEIAATARAADSSVSDTVVETVFFGGGTPSLLPVPLFTTIMNELRRHFRVASDAEISMEMDPGTFDGEKLAGFLESGITRVSLGVQSFQAELLKTCGRAHGLEEVYEAVRSIQVNGLENWSLDLMGSLPNQSAEQWEHSLTEALSARPAHVSVYDLQIEEGTLFNRWFKAGQAPLPSDEKSAELYRSASRRLREGGFEHYEVSNYARPGFQCRHNLVYWDNLPYYAFGLGSTSYLRGRRFTRPKKFKAYAAYVQRLENGSKSGAAALLPETSLEEEALDTVMLSLRLARGLDLGEFEEKFGSQLTCKLCSALVPFLEMDLVEVLDPQRQRLSSGLFAQRWKGSKKYADYRHVPSENCSMLNSHRDSAQGFENLGVSSVALSEAQAGFVRLSDPEGFLLSNEVISSIFAAL